ncbi:histidinol-phosphate transaminase [Agrococcus sp. HG114]|uniref:histidinol-phosphate transaminase n=1 Tax=Agrococcus sp. HG114 TaxID=2969757 RepID=UPI00215A93B3|nr:histidinol-phosphate transaminase [Agrococcus sp. HG114]MCR8671399.1 histidinol-phosphate transaminase [Agrococcus sp. HG114]
MTVRLRPEIAAVPPYQQGRPAPEGGFKLSSNENPFPPLPAVVEAVQREAERVNRYPRPGSPLLQQALARELGVDAERILIGDGSASLLQQLIHAVAGVGDEVVYAWRSFDAYPLFVRTGGATPVEVPLGPDHEHDLDAMAAAITERTRAVLVCSPNNPTGTIVDPGELEAFLDRVPSDVLVMLDEAYVEFVREPVPDGIALQRQRDNVVVLRTFSKAYGLAGLRVGYAVGDPAVLRGADLTGVPLSQTALGSAAAIAALEHRDENLERIEQIVQHRDALWRALVDAGVAVPRPHGNFLWVPSRPGQEDAIHDILFANRLVAKVFPEGTRISVGEPEADELVVAAATAIQALQ